jgi:hypothetical protein
MSKFFDEIVAAYQHIIEDNNRTIIPAHMVVPKNHLQSAINDDKNNTSSYSISSTMTTATAVSLKSTGKTPKAALYVGIGHCFFN